MKSVFLAFSALSLPMCAGAADGAFEINQDCALAGCFAGDDPGYPVTIAQGGRYVLSSDLAPGNGVAAISIVSASAPIDIDLGGHTIDGGGACSGAPVTGCSGAQGTIGIDSSDDTGAAVSIHIHDGTVRGFAGNGISLTVADDGTLLDHLTVAQNGSVGVFLESTTLFPVLRVRDVEIARNASWGIASSNPLDIRDSTIAGNGGIGINLSSAPSGSTSSGNRLLRNGGVGIFCAAAACALGQNTFAGNNVRTAGTPQYDASARGDMGGNVCLDHANSVCP